MFARDVEQRAARHEHLEAGRGGEQRGDLACSPDDVLEVVEDNHDVAGPEVRADRLLDWPIRGSTKAKSVREGLHHQARIADRREGHEPDPVVETTEHSGGDLGREAGLASPWGPSNG